MVVARAVSPVAVLRRRHLALERLQQPAINLGISFDASPLPVISADVDVGGIKCERRQPVKVSGVSVTGLGQSQKFCVSASSVSPIPAGVVPSPGCAT